MLDVGKTLLREDITRGDVDVRFGYHLRPINSVDHIHMHCLVAPYVPWYQWWKYSAWNVIGWRTAGYVMRQLKRGAMVW